MQRDAVLNIRVPSQVKVALKRAADDDFGRSSSGMVVKILTEWLTEKGYLMPPQPRPPRKGAD